MVFVDASADAVGFGTATPTSDVTISNATGGTLVIERQDSSIVGTDTIGSIKFNGTDPSGSNTSAEIRSVSTDNWGASSFASDFRFYTADGAASPSEVMRITAGGALGLGVTTPTSTMDVSVSDGDGITITNTADTHSGEIRFADTSDADVGIIEYDHNDNSLAITTNASEAMRIDSSGNVGVGRAPTTSFDIYSTTAQALLTVQDARAAAGTAGIQMIQSRATATGSANDGDEIGQITGRFYNSASQKTVGYRIKGVVDDVTDTTEDATMTMDVMTGGTLSTVATFVGGEVFLNLPTSAGTAGSLWSNSGVVTVA
jgi:hypothetical protein